jgi:hypothetical protein
MTVLVDEARWWWRGRRWAHLVSDSDLDELHDFAGRLGVRRISFGGDHYDVTEPQRAAAVAAGAEPVGARELVRRLRAGGLRRPPGGGPHRWQPLAERVWAPPERPGVADLLNPDPNLDLGLGLELGPPAAESLEAVLRRWSAGRPLSVRVLRRVGERAMVFTEVEPPDPGADPAPQAVRLPDPVAPIAGWYAWPERTGQPRSLEVFIATPNEPKAPGWMMPPPEPPRAPGPPGR